MGCPPDPMEVSMWRSQERTRETEQKVARINREFDSLREDIGPLIAAAEQDTDVRVLWTRCEEALLLHAPQPAPEKFPSNLQGEYDAVFEGEKHQEAELKRAENRLCILRDFFIKAWKKEKVRSQFQSLEPVYQNEYSEQMQHRREDYKEWVEWLRVNIKHRQDSIRHYKKIPGWEEAIRKMESAILKMQEELKRVQALPEDLWLHDRDTFGQNAGDFTTDL